MATIYDVAQHCGMSIATVSYVLNGKAEQHHISTQTVKRVLEAAEELNYVLIRASGRQRKSAKLRKIAILWPDYYPGHELISVFSAMHQTSAESTEQIDFNLKPYGIGMLEQTWIETGLDVYDGIVLFAANETDLKYLISRQDRKNVITVNRSIEGYSSVSVDNNEAGRIACDQLYGRCGKSLSAVVEKTFYIGRGTRSIAFRDRAKELDISLDDHIYTADGSYDEGYRLAMDFLRRGVMTKGIFFTHDHTAVGFQAAMAKKGIRSGKDYYLIAAELGDSDLCRYATPSITAVNLRMKEVTISSLEICLKQLSVKNQQVPEHRIIRPEIIFRQSLPESIKII